MIYNKLEKIDNYFSEVLRSMNEEEYKYQRALVDGAELLLKLRSKGCNRKELEEYIIKFYKDYCLKTNDYNVKFDDFLVDFVADIKGPPWSRYLDFWDSEIIFEKYKLNVFQNNSKN